MIGSTMVPREGTGVPNYTQDQTSDNFGLYFIKATGAATTLAAPAVLDAYTIDLTSAVGFSADDRTGIFSTTGDFYFGTQLGAAVGNVITLDTPLNVAFPAGSNVLQFTKDLAVNGTVGPGGREIFQIGPFGLGVALELDVTFITGVITDNAVMDYSTFGGGSALTRGCVFRKNNGVMINYANWKTNGDIRAYAGSPLGIVNKAGGGEYGLDFTIKYAGQQNRGVAIRLEPGDTLEMLIQDNLSGLLNFEMLATCHVVV